MSTDRPPEPSERAPGLTALPKAPPADPHAYRGGDERQHPALRWLLSTVPVLMAGTVTAILLPDRYLGWFLGLAATVAVVLIVADLTVGRRRRPRG